MLKGFKGTVLEKKNNLLIFILISIKMFLRNVLAFKGLCRKVYSK